jgi:hypothetical protein
MNVRFRTVDSILDEMEAMQRRIADRAQKIFRERGGALGHALEDWVTAERGHDLAAGAGSGANEGCIHRRGCCRRDRSQALRRTGDTDRAAAGRRCTSFGSRTGRRVVLCEFAKGPLFRSYNFPEPIDPQRVSAEYRNGLLRVTAPRAHPATKVEIQAA